jgi:hypothetical protein
MTVMLKVPRQEENPYPKPDLGARIAALDWAAISADLDAFGYATTGMVLSEQQCEFLAQCFAADELFRSRVIMARHGFGRGEYKYFAYPLPEMPRCCAPRFTRPWRRSPIDGTSAWELLRAIPASMRDIWQCVARLGK